jgi:hypothetical protein
VLEKFFWNLQQHAILVGYGERIGRREETSAGTVNLELETVLV